MTKKELMLENFLTAEAYGIESQINQAMEEMAELTQALSKARRVWLDAGQPADMDVKEVHEAVTEEIADVEIMLEQIKFLLFVRESRLEDIKREKIERTMIRREKMRQQRQPGNWKADVRRKAANPYAGEKKAEGRWLKECMCRDS